MSYLVWNLNNEVIKALCISDSFWHFTCQVDRSFEELISTMLGKELEDFESLAELMRELEADGTTREMLSTANSNLQLVFNNDEPSGMKISAYEFYNFLFSIEDLFDE